MSQTQSTPGGGGEATTEGTSFLDQVVAATKQT